MEFVLPNEQNKTFNRLTNKAATAIRGIENMKIEFDLEASEQGSAFYGIYAGLRMFMDYKQSITEERAINFAAAENYCRLQELKKQYPEQYKEAEEEYDMCYKGVATIERKED